jgi:hypothetical protein
MVANEKEKGKGNMFIEAQENIVNVSGVWSDVKIEMLIEKQSSLRRTRIKA